MNKKGSSHVEYIIAFILFFGFVAATLGFFRPLERFSSNKDILETVQTGFIDAASVSVKDISLIMDETLSSESGNYASFPTSIANLNDERGLRVENYDGQIINSYEDNGEVLFLLDDILFSRGKGYALIRISEGINESDASFNGDAINISDLLIVGFIESESILSEMRLAEIQRQYNENYLGLKENLGILISSDFGFRISFPDGTLLEGKRDPPDQVEVYSYNERREILRNDGSKVFAEIRVEAW